MAINHYQLLGIPEDADDPRIKAAYRSMAKRFHPDTNQGSEAAAELFRKINEAYRVLSDARLRALYNRELAKNRPAQEPHTPQKKKSVTLDPQQKFQRFLNSLLDAIFEAPDPPADEPTAQPRATTISRPTHKPRQQPDFDFYYYLAMERQAPAYACGADGIYRRAKGKPPPQNR